MEFRKFVVLTKDMNTQVQSRYKQVIPNTPLAHRREAGRALSEDSNGPELVDLGEQDKDTAKG